MTATMTPPPPHGGGMDQGPILLLRQMFLEGLVLLAGDQQRIEQLCARFDTLRQGSQEDWPKEMRKTIEQLYEEISIAEGYPAVEAHLPHISIETASESEDASMATAGRELGRSTSSQGTGDDAVGFLHIHRGGAYKSILEIACWHGSSEVARLMQQLVIHMLEMHRGALINAGITGTSTSTTGFRPDPTAKLAPVGWVPVVSLQMTFWRVATTMSEGVKKQASFGVTYSA